MPTYQYACTVDDCGHQFEAVQSFTDDALTECPVCTGRLRKVFNSVGVVFKGSGFYRTDSREAAKKQQGDGGDAGKTAKDGAAKADKPSSTGATSSEKSSSNGSGSKGAGSSSSSSSKSSAGSAA